MIKMKNFEMDYALLKLKVSWEFSRIISCSPDPSLRTGKKRRRQTLCDKRDNNFVSETFPPNFTLL